MNRMNRVAIVAGALIACVCAVPVVRGGNLAPPPGPIVPTNQSILSQATTPGPHTIAAPGSYKLTSDLTCLGGPHALRITAAGVTLDLNGFTINGTGATTVGIDVAGSDVRIHNGRIIDCVNHGILCTGASGTIVEDVRIRLCDTGIQLNATGRVSRCELQNCNTNAISGTTLTIESTRMESCAQLPGSFAIQMSAGVVRDCVISAAVGGINCVGYATVERCQVSAAEIGFRGLIGSIFRGCTAAHSNIAGFWLSGASAFECIAQNCPTGAAFDANFGAIVDRCLAVNNGGDGIRVGDGCSITGNNCHSNGIQPGTGGIAVNGQNSRVSNNSATNNNNFNFRCSGLASTVYANTASGLGPGFNYVLAGSDVAPISTAAAATVGNENIEN